ncbi:putative c2h2 transcription factor [Golovinomyces cichoracearum]|uniref:C2H2 type master regulator of conidiophore development brlA n=1 Tax=Golovinomyces cichoracearum TaxID=62708 RepID=A0A420INI3_9PEZI|nr:putative c2h2 transcription factor [Golovinomyces cichoracearum]
MFARDSAGRSVSLLNDEPYDFSNLNSSIYNTPRFNNDLFHSQTIRSYASSPATPSLTDADSYDTSFSPITPTSSYQELSPHMNYQPMAAEKKVATHLNFNDEKISSAALSSSPVESDRSRQSSTHCLKYEVRGAYREPLVYDEDSYFKRANTNEHAPRRYPCRYRDSHHCQKTFTTSGHASRHSKIHTAEKGVSCTWAGCQKKFTRSDNMKQHLETHTKERLRATKTNTTTPNLDNETHRTETTRDRQTNMATLTVSARVKKPSGSRRSTGRSKSADSNASTPLSQSHNSAHSSMMQYILNPADENLNLTFSTGSTSANNHHIGPTKNTLVTGAQF